MPGARVHLALAAVQLLFGTLPLAGQVAMEGIPPLGLAALRIGGAALVLAFWAGRRLASVALADIPVLALYAALAIVGNQVLFLEGLSRTTQVNAAVLITTVPVFTMGFALALGRERASALRGAGIAVGLAGALALTGLDRFDLSDRAMSGNLMVVVNASFWSLYLVLARPMLQRLDPLVVMTWMFLIGALGFLPFGMPAVAGAVGEARWESWLAAAWVVTGPTVASYVLSVWALRHAESTSVAAYTYVQPVVAGVLAWLVVGETPGTRTAVAAAAIFAGVAAVQVSGRASRRRNRSRGYAGST